jgi:Reverse transcriptase (RNA-dependent DNA polymerase)
MFVGMLLVFIFHHLKNSGITLHCIEEAVYAHIGYPIILLGDINVDLHHIKNDRAVDISTALMQHGLHDVGDYFLHPRERWTYSQYRNSQWIKSTTDCLLSEQPNLFRRWAIKIPRFDSDHRAIIGEVMINSIRKHSRYVSFRRRCPTVVLPRPLNRVDQLYENLLKYKPQPTLQQQRDKSWIASDTWQVIDQRSEITRRLHSPPPVIGSMHNWSETSVDELEQLRRQLGRKIRFLLRRDRQQRVEKVSIKIEQQLLNKNIHQAYEIFRGWYRDFSGVRIKPTQQNIHKIRQDFTSLLSYHISSGEPLPIHVAPFAVNDNIPTAEEIYTAIQHLRKRRTPGPSGITAEDLLSWHENIPEAWAIVLTLVQTAFDTGIIASHMAEGILCLLPKSDGSFRGISLLETLHKVCTAIIHLRMSSSIEFHSWIHGFRRHRGTGTAILEAKLEMQLANNSYRPLFQIYLDLKKAYDSLDRERTLLILAGYGVGPRTCRLIQQIWDHQLLIPRSAGYYGSAFHPERGVPQGDLTSPIIFNIIVDCVVREWLHTISSSENLIAIFYADDGRLAGFSAQAVQEGLDLFQSIFARVGLQLNPVKTKAMVSLCTLFPRSLSTVAYKRRFDHSLPSYQQRKAMKIACQLCNKPIRSENMGKHLFYKHGKSPNPFDYNSPLTEPVVTYTVNYVHDSIPCPISGCPAVPVNWCHMREHFARRHPTAIIINSNEGLLPQCFECGRFLHSINDAHLASRACRELAARRFAWTQFDNYKRAVNTVFFVNSSPIETVSKFKYLGRFLSSDDRDDFAVETNIRKTRLRWGRCGRILSSIHATPKIMARFYLAVCQAILLYGSETWVVSQRSLQQLQTFHHCCARHMAHQHIRRLPDNSWLYPSSSDILDLCGLFPISLYITQRKHHLLHHYAEPYSNLYRYCLDSTRYSICSSHHREWWQ